MLEISPYSLCILTHQKVVYINFVNVVLKIITENLKRNVSYVGIKLKQEDWWKMMKLLKKLVSFYQIIILVQCVIPDIEQFKEAEQKEFIKTLPLSYCRVQDKIKSQIERTKLWDKIEDYGLDRNHKLNINKKETIKLSKKYSLKTEDIKGNTDFNTSSTAFLINASTSALV